MKAKLHHELGSYNFIEVEIEEDTKEALIASTLDFLGKVRLGYASLQENGITGDLKPSEKQMTMVRRLIREKDKKVGDILRYLGGNRLTKLEDITKEECSHIIDLLTKGEKSAEASV